MYRFVFGGIHAEITAPDGQTVTAQVTPERAEILRRLVDAANEAEKLRAQVVELTAELESDGSRTFNLALGKPVETLKFVREDEQP